MFLKLPKKLYIIGRYNHFYFPKNHFTLRVFRLILLFLQDLCAEELKRAKQHLNSKEGGYLKARDSTIRHVNSVPTNGGSADLNRKLKELDNRRRKEEEALSRVSFCFKISNNCFRKPMQRTMFGEWNVSWRRDKESWTN